MEQNPLRFLIKRDRPKKMVTEKSDKSQTRAFTSMLTNTLRNHYMLNQMVDRKARIILSINIVVLSFVIGGILQNTTGFKTMQTTLAIGSFFILLSIVFSVLAVLPKNENNSLTAEKLKIGRLNPLFFGNFLSMDPISFENSMMEMSGDTNFALRSMLKDLYQIGLVLNRKRRFLRYSVVSITIGFSITLFLSLLLKVF